jgi:type IV secretion system protein VirD4
MTLMTVIQQLGIWGRQHATLVLMALGTLAALALIVQCWRRGSAPGATSHGSARWATLRDIRKAGLCAAHGVLLGKMGRHRIRSDAGHVLVCGSTGTGKDLTIHFPTTRTWPDSMLIVDVKDGGENYIQCRSARPGLVYRFAPTLPGSHRLNLLAHIDPQSPAAFRDVSILTESFLAPRLRGVRPSDSGEYFRKQASSALRAVTLHCLQTMPRCAFPRVLATMATAKPLLQAMCQNATPYIRATGERLRDMERQAEKQFAGIWDTALGALDIFNDPVVAAVTQTSDFALTDLQHGAYPMTLYLGANAPTEVTYLAPLFRAILQSALHQLMMRTGYQRELLWLLNEFPTLGYMEMTEQACATVRSHGMRFLFAIQDLGQLWETYGQETPIWGNCRVKAFLGTSNDHTAKRLSELLGPETVASAGTSTQGTFGRRTHSQHDAGRPLLTPAEVLGLSVHEVILRVDDCPHPLRIQKCWEGN